ncbi:MAG: 3-hydroxyacyl-CoA dehydrogenase/enoyl-CoA hydratase family protein [Rhodocyclaceae bacterium]|jgi:3-hydroxyacyl-CoA dehydrogenase|nr:3-hydroxyacyl-CoA dehydrogenase/enoyl-CoA hydratase family protein [Rhodocyclaceae bacterium]
MSRTISKAAVIGAGSMGSGIAAQFANGGIPVVLLDMAPAGAADRKAFAKGGIERQLKSGGFMHPEAANLVTPGNIDDDLDLLADADIIVEAIIEDLDAKRALFTKLEKVRKAGSIVSSNTSTLARASMCEGLPESFRRDFVITHFFNPVRHMRLLEVVSGPDNGPGVAARAALSGEVDLGKTVIACRDTPGFIANRLGCYWMAMATREAFAHGLTAEEADAVAGAPFGVPKTGVFGLFDLVGIDLVPLVWAGLLKTLPADDGIQVYNLPDNAVFKGMLAAGRFGRKSKAGFYRQSAADKKQREVVDFSTLEYRAEQPVAAAALPGGGKDLKQLCSGDDKFSRYAWTVLKRVVVYASRVAPEIADDVAAIDAALELGYAWGKGPFALADRVGAAWIVERLKTEGEFVPPLLARAADAGGFYADGGKTLTRTDGSRVARARAAGVVCLADIKEKTAPVLNNDSATLWDMGDGIVCLELKTKMNILDNGVFDLIELAVDRVPKDFRGLVIGNEHVRAFSAGASLEVLLGRIKQGDFIALRDFVLYGQKVYKALKYAPFPVVGAAFGIALGGGCEALLHCDAIVAHAELTAGLPEANVGLIPGWGGCTQLLARAERSARGIKGPLGVANRVFEVIASATVSGSAAQARDSGILRDSDPIVMSRDRLLSEARGEAVRLAEAGYRAPEPTLLTLSGPSGYLSLMNSARTERAAGRITATDMVVREVLATVLTGGKGADPVAPVSEDVVYALEVDGLVELARTEATKARIEHLLATGKPLRN